MWLDRFLDVLYYKDFSRLIIEGNPPEELLKEAWHSIYLQYSEMMQEGGYNELYEKTKEMQALNGRIAFLDGAIQYLQLNYDESVIKMINEMGIALSLTADEDASKKLKPVHGRVKRMILDLQRIQKEVAALQETKAADTKIDYYEDWLSIMSKSYGYAVKAKDITVTQFVRNLKRINAQHLKQQQDGARKD